MDITKIMTFVGVMGLIAFTVGMFLTMFTDDVMSRFWGKFWEWVSGILVVGGLLAAVVGFVTNITVWTFFS